MGFSAFRVSGLAVLAALASCDARPSGCPAFVDDCSPANAVRTSEPVSCLAVASDDIGFEAGSWIVTGTARNQCGRTIGSGRVVYKITNSSGAIIGNVSDSVSGIEAGGTWKFKATGPVPDEDFGGYELVSVEAAE